MRLLDLKTKNKNEINLRVYIGTEFKEVKFFKILSEARIIIFLIFLGFIIPMGGGSIYTNSFYNDEEKSNLYKTASRVASEVEQEVQDSLVAVNNNSEIIKNFIISAELEKISDGVKIEVNPVTVGNCENINFGYTKNNQQIGNTHIWDNDFSELEWQIKMSPIDKTKQIDCQISLKFYSSFGNNFGEEIGFYDLEETGTFDFKFKPSKPVFLNEIVADPATNQTPAGEWIELYNQGDVAIDVFGWQISEMTSTGTENKYQISNIDTSSTFVTWGGGTLIPAGGFIVVLIDGNRLNNAGDTVRLYDDGGKLVDEFSFEDAEKGQSFSRLPDGIGDFELAKLTPKITNQPLTSSSANFNSEVIEFNSAIIIDEDATAEVQENNSEFENQPLDPQLGDQENDTQNENNENITNEVIQEIVQETNEDCQNNEQELFLVVDESET